MFTNTMKLKSSHETRKIIEKYYAIKSNGSNQDQDEIRYVYHFRYSVALASKFNDFVSQVINQKFQKDLNFIQIKANIELTKELRYPLNLVKTYIATI